MHSSVTKSGMKCILRNSAVEPKLDSAKLAAAVRGALTLAVLCALLVASGPRAHAQTETVLYSFAGGFDGVYPNSVPVLGKKGNLYGTTQDGGDYYYGTVWDVTPSGTETILHSFQNNGTDGGNPSADLARDKEGNLYGTTFDGGAYGSGTLFELNPFGTETILYSFNPGNGTDGGNPSAGLVLDKEGNLYGTTLYDGAYSGGSVFELTPSGTETILWSFGSGTDGYSPLAGLVLDKKGNLYGTTLLGGAYGGGTVFEVTPSGTETILHSFDPNGTDGSYPYGRLVRDKKGNLYGTTSTGGAYGYGAVFEVTPSGTETILHSFDANGTDGYSPFAALVLDKGGNLYGTTENGGTYDYGTVFELTPAGTETILYSFNPGNGTDGYYPFSGLVLDKKGNLYGTTLFGGAYSYGTVYKVTP